MQLRHIYVTLMIPGGILPLLLLAGFFSETGGPDVGAFVVNIFTISKASAAVATDLFLTGGVFLIFVVAEGVQLKIPHLWIYFILAPVVGVCFALPLFLYVRDRQVNAAGPPLADTGIVPSGH